MPRYPSLTGTLAWLLTSLCLLMSAAPLAWGDQSDAIELYRSHVRPVLQERCFACHGALKQESGLRTDAAALLLAGGDSGESLVPGDVEESPLWWRVTAEDEYERMPPEGPPLSTAQLEALRRWIEAGAPAPADEQPEPDPRAHWAFQPPERPAVPAHGDAAPGNPIDAFLQASQRQQGLRPLPAAEPSVQLRRLYLDLIGLPPSRDEQRAFFEDAREDAYERLVDQLLASPHHGERWGRHWMDIWRYSDWYGLGDQLRNSQKHLWHWRDWIVQSLNDDKGYDQMVLEMLAADEIAPTDHDPLRATGFLARNYYLFNRDTWLDSTVEHTAKAMLGLTINCAKCHDHKYDPIAQEDYYRFRAFFEPHQVRLDPLPGSIDLEQNGLPRVFDLHADAPTYVYVRGEESQPDTDRPMRPDVPELLRWEPLSIEAVALPAEAHAPHLQAFVLDDRLAAAAQAIRSAESNWQEARQKWEESEGSEEGTAESLRWAAEAAEGALQAARLEPQRLRAVHRAERARHDGSAAEVLEARVREAAELARRHELALAEESVARHQQKVAEAAAAVQAGTEGAEGASENAQQELATAQQRLAAAREALEAPGENYPPLRVSRKAAEGPDETEESLQRPYPPESTGRRTALARWIVDPRNPLTARVAVNHLWMRHMGQPLVESVFDFGRRAPAPAQQALLDYLAIELIESGWSMKHLHRLIVTSDAYRRSGQVTLADEATAAADPDNVYYWRRLPVRMESQVVRDSLLQLAGKLDLTLGGASIDPAKHEEAARRSLYFLHGRDDRHRFLTMFDDADIAECYRRHESIVPQQALALANSRVALAAARDLEVRIAAALSESADSESADEATWVRHAFETILGAPPTAEELRVCQEMMEKMRSIEGPEAEDAERQVRTHVIHALINHHDFITIR